MIRPDFSTRVHGAGLASGPPRRRRVLVRASATLVVLAGLLDPGLAAAQPSPRVEVWGAVSFASSPEAGEVRSDYRPEAVSFTSTSSRGQQVLVLESEGRVGFEAGLQAFFSRHLGARITVAVAEGDLSGPNAPYAIELDYVARFPPSYTPTPSTYRRSFDWPATTGTLQHVTTMVGPVVRSDPGRPVEVQATVALAIVRTSGEVAPLGFTRFRLGGHSTLFYDDFRLTLALEPATRVGLGLGGDVAVGLGTHVALVAGARFVAVGEAKSALRVVSVDRALSGFDPPPAADIEARLALNPARVPGRHWQGVAGLRVRF